MSQSEGSPAVADEPYVPQHVYNLQPSPHDPRDYRLDAPVDASLLPSSAMLPKVPPTRDQGQEGSCWGFSGSGAHQNARNIAGIEDAILSPAFLYWKTREAMGDDSIDGGSDIRTGLDTLLKMGNCTEDHMPYTAGDFRTAPTQAAMIDAQGRTIYAYHRLTGINDIKYAITQSLGVVFGIPVYQAFETSKDGHVPMPDKGENPLGGHAIQCIGYADSPNFPGGGCFVLLNSWGPNAGDHGRYYIPYAYMTDLAWAEAWSITAAGSTPPPPTPDPTPKPAPGVTYTDPITGKKVDGAFLDYFNEKGGIPILGRPITDAMASVIPHDQKRVVQYFERDRLELWPENPPGWTVLGTSFVAMVAHRLGFAGPGIDGVTDIIPALSTQEVATTTEANTLRSVATSLVTAIDSKDKRAITRHAAVAKKVLNIKVVGGETYDAVAAQ
jgi:hypothetical protein